VEESKKRGGTDEKREGKEKAEMGRL